MFLREIQEKVTLLAILVVINIQSTAYAIDKIPLTEGVKYKTLEEVQKGIANQLEYLIDYNETSTQGEKWYVYVVGDDTFNPEMMSGEGDTFLENQFDLTDIGIENTPIDNIEELNEALETYNTKLKEAGKPLIYYGVSNKKTAILAPYFSPKGKAESMKSYYADLIEEKEPEKEALQQTLKNLTHFFDKEIRASMTTLVQNTIAKASGNGAVALSKYYFALKKESGMSGQSGSIKWYSVSKYDHKGSYFETNPINKKELNNQIKMLSTIGDKNLKRINGWYNYLMGVSLPDSKLLQDMLVDLLGKSSCVSIENAEAVRQKEIFIKSITTEDAQQIIKATENLCSDVLRTIDYTYISKAINTIAKGGIKEAGEAVILYYLHTIPNTHYAALFDDLKNDNNKLLRTLLAEMDNMSINPFDEKHYTSFLGALLYIGHQNDGEYLKKEREYLLNTVFEAEKEFNWDKNPIAKAITQIASFNIPSDDESFEKYLTNDEYKNLRNILRFLTWDTVYNEEYLKELANTLGPFLNKRDNHKVFIELLETAFGSKKLTSNIDPQREERVAHFVLDIFAHVPKDAKMYFYLVGQDFTMEILKKVITSGYVRDSYATNFYKGLDKIISLKKDQQVHLTLIRWALRNDIVLDSSHEYLVANIFNNVNDKTKEEKEIIYNFLTYSEGDVTSEIKSYQYLKTCLKLLNSNELEGQFISNYTKLLKNDGIGDVQDRINILEYALDRGESIFFSDSEGLISHLFDNLSITDAELISKELKANNNQLLGRIWNVLHDSGITEIWNTDNEYATNFVKQLSDIIKMVNPIPDTRHVDQFLMDKVDYLNTSDISKIDKIDMEEYLFAPMLKTNLFGNSTGGTYNYNYFKFESNIDFTTESAYVTVNLRIKDGYGQNGKTIIDAKKIDPMSWVTVQFLDDTSISDQVSYKKGTIIVVPAMYLAWMDNLIDGAKNEKLAAIIGETAAIIVGGVVIASTGGVLAPLLGEGVEVVFASVNLMVEIDEEGMKNAFGADFVQGVQTIILLYELAQIPAALPELFTLATKGGKIIARSGTAGFKMAVEGMKSFKGHKITYNGGLLLPSLRGLKAESSDEFASRYKQARELLASQEMAIDNLASAAVEARKDAKKLRDQTQAIVKAFEKIDGEDILDMTQLPNSFRSNLITLLQKGYRVTKGGLVYWGNTLLMQIDITAKKIILIGKEIWKEIDNTFAPDAVVITPEGYQVRVKMDTGEEKPLGERIFDIMKSDEGTVGWQGRSGNPTDDLSFDFLSDIKNWNDTDTDGLKEALKNDPEIAKLFANAIDDAEKIRLAQSWKLLSKFPDKVTPDHITLLYRVADQVKTKSAQGKEALETIFKKIDKYKIGDVLQSLNTADQVFGKIKGAGEKLIAFYDVSIPDIIKVIDGSNNQKKPVCKINNGLLMSSGIKQLHGKDLEVVGHYKEYDIVRNANNELGFKQKSWSDFFVNMEKTSDWNSSYKDELQSFLEDNSNIKKIFNEVLQAPGDLNDVFRIWLILKKNPVAVKSADNFNIILKTKGFVYDGEKGIAGFEKAFKKRDILEQSGVFKGLERANQLFNPSKLKGTQVEFSITKVDYAYYPNVMDQAGQICYYKDGLPTYKRGIEDGEELITTADHTILKNNNSIGFKNGDFYLEEGNSFDQLFDQLGEDWTNKELREKIGNFIADHKSLNQMFSRSVAIDLQKQRANTLKKLIIDHDYPDVCIKNPTILDVKGEDLTQLLTDFGNADELARFFETDTRATQLWQILKKGDERLNNNEEYTAIIRKMEKDGLDIEQVQRAIQDQGYDTWINGGLLITDKQFKTFFNELGKPWKGDEALQEEFLRFKNDNPDVAALFTTIKTTAEKKNAKEYLKVWVALKDKYAQICNNKSVLRILGGDDARLTRFINDLDTSQNLVETLKSNPKSFYNGWYLLDVLNQRKACLNQDGELAFLQKRFNEMDDDIKESRKWTTIEKEIKEAGSFEVWRENLSGITIDGKNYIARDIAGEELYIHTSKDANQIIYGKKAGDKFTETIQFDRLDKNLVITIQSDQGMQNIGKAIYTDAIKRLGGSDTVDKIKFIDTDSDIAKTYGDQWVDNYKYIKEGNEHTWVKMDDATNDSSFRFVDNIKDWEDTDTKGLKQTLERDSQIAKLFADANDLEKIKYAELWKMANKFLDYRTAENITLMYKAVNKFKKPEQEGIEVLKEVFAELTKGKKVSGFFESLKEVNPVFYEIDIACYQWKNSIGRMIILDGKGHKVCEFDGDRLIVRGFKKIDVDEGNLVKDYYDITDEMYQIWKNGDELGLRYPLKKDYIKDLEKEWEAALFNKFKNELKTNKEFERIFMTSGYGESIAKAEAWKMLIKHPDVNTVGNIEFIASVYKQFEFGNQKGIEGLDAVLSLIKNDNYAGFIKGLRWAKNEYHPPYIFSATKKQDSYAITVFDEDIIGYYFAGKWYPNQFPDDLLLAKKLNKQQHDIYSKLPQKKQQSFIDLWKKHIEASNQENKKGVIDALLKYLNEGGEVCR
jgi:uncharacterized coiled-coil protein SlyX